MQTHPLRTYRTSKSPKQSQADLADILGVSRLTVLRWENGDRKINESLLSTVSKKTGIPAKELRPDLVERLEQLVGGDQ
jgi:transcriptional regulator with XRE-family HTH domain